MRCEKIRMLLSAYLEKLASPREEASIREHLAECSACRGVLEDLKKTEALVKELQEVEPPPWLKQKIMAEVRQSQQEAQKAGFWKKLFYPWHIKIPVEALATALIVILAVQVYRTMEPVKAPLPEPTQSREMAPIERNRQEPQKAAPPAGAAALPNQPGPSVGKAEKAAPPAQFRAKDQITDLKKDVAPKPAERTQIKKEVAPLRQQGASHLEEKSALPAAMTEARQPESPPVPAYNKEEQRHSELSDKEEAYQPKRKLLKALPADSATKSLAGAAAIAPVELAPLQLTLRTSDPTAASAELEAFLNGTKAKTFGRVSRNGHPSYTTTLSRDEAAALLTKLKTLGAVSPDSLQTTHGETNIRVDIIQVEGNR